MTRKEYLERNRLLRNIIGSLIVVILSWSVITFVWQIPSKFHCNCPLYIHKSFSRIYDDGRTDNIVVGGGNCGGHF